jgi:UDP-N-acetylglucosamine--N-acetylmuramyl-(pentapeptide) pyrophosphoryl-undecaprenol N-acetylglucosamine transferase
VIPAALAALPDGLCTRLSVVQQCRPEDLEQVRAAYAASNIPATLDSFFTDIPERMAAAHLVIARAGASTVAELTCLGRPSILVPYPHATDDHQTANARAVDEAGGAWLMPQPAFTAAALTARLEQLFCQPGTLARAAGCARAAGRPDAAARLADLAVSLSPLRKESRP